LETLADILVKAAASGRRFVVIDDGSGCPHSFADDLAATVRASGAACARISDDSTPSVDLTPPDGVVAQPTLEGRVGGADADRSVGGADADRSVGGADLDGLVGAAVGAADV
jgi:hypothetical protein